MLQKVLKIVKSIDGSENIAQLEVCFKMIENFVKVDKPLDERLINDLKLRYSVKYKELEKLVVC